MPPGLPLSIPALVRERARSRAGFPAIVDRDVSGTAVTLSFEDLLGACMAAARSVVAAGLEPGERAAIWAPNIHEWAVAALGILAAGGAVVPVNTRFRAAEARYLLEKSHARLLFTVRGFLANDYPEILAEAYGGTKPAALSAIVVLREMGSKEPAASGAMAWDEFLASGEPVPVAEVEKRGDALGPGDLSDVIFTSGTTGNPKGVMATHGQTLRVFDTWASTVGLEPSDRYLVVNPFFHTFGYKAGLIASLINGATVYPMATLDAVELMATVERERISVLPGPPTLYTTILDHPERSKYDLSSLRLAVTGAASVPVELIRRMSEELGFETVLTAYGLTEATGTVTMCRRGDSYETIARTSGRAIPGTEVRVVDESGQQADTGAPGEVVVRGYNVMTGYLDDPEQTAVAIDAGGWLHTGDVGVLDVDGNLSITDRLKDMFIVGGFNAYPAEIENLLAEHPSVSQVAVVGVPDERLGEVGAAFIVLKPGAVADAAGLEAWSREKMANYKVPRSFRFVDSLPLNASGKVLKTELRARATDG